MCLPSLRTVVPRHLDRGNNGRSTYYVFVPSAWGSHRRLQLEALRLAASALWRAFEDTLSVPVRPDDTNHQLGAPLQPMVHMLGLEIALKTLDAHPTACFAPRRIRMWDADQRHYYAEQYRIRYRDGQRLLEDVDDGTVLRVEQRRERRRNEMQHIAEQSDAMRPNRLNIGCRRKNGT